jgi:hypothetical protein
MIVHQHSEGPNSPNVVGTLNVYPDSGQFAPPSPDVSASVKVQLQALKGRFPEDVVVVEYEAGNHARRSVAEALGRLLESAKIGSCPSGNTFIGRFPDHPVTVFYAPEDEAFRVGLVQALGAYVKAQPVIHYETWANQHFVRIYLHGEPTFQPDGTVEFR